jgi:hypothetical protein
MRNLTCYRFSRNAEMLRILNIILAKIEVSTALDLTRVSQTRYVEVSTALDLTFDSIKSTKNITLILS